MSNRYEAVGLKKIEYQKIIEVLGREPNDLELNMYGAMWSEHCSYKHSRILFRHFPTSGKRVLQGPGENAGIVDIGDNMAIAMKIESHNSPTAVDPYQGAATGVGGILRDIFAMGARPIAFLNSLRFGDIRSDRIRGDHSHGSQDTKKDHGVRYPSSFGSNGQNGPNGAGESDRTKKDHGVRYPGSFGSIGSNGPNGSEKDHGVRPPGSFGSNGADIPNGASGLDSADGANCSDSADGAGESDRTKFLLREAVKGMADYTKVLEIPTVGGEIYFNHTYEGNPLVNAMCLGLVDHDKIHRANASGVDNPVMYMGSATGMDGIGGASFSSSTLEEDGKGVCPVGNPELGKRVMEACLELLKTGSVVGLQDMGAAGLTSACSETAVNGEGGMEIDVLKVPRRVEGMNPTEVMLSESQERMLLIVEKGREEQVCEIVQKWDLHSVVIGKVTDDGMLTVKEGNAIVAKMPSESLDSSGAPEYDTDYEQPKYIEEDKIINIEDIPEPEDYNEVFLKLLTSPNIASREWIYKQFDGEDTEYIKIMGGSDSNLCDDYSPCNSAYNTENCRGSDSNLSDDYSIRQSEQASDSSKDEFSTKTESQEKYFSAQSDASVLQIKGTNKGIALTTDCNSRYCYLNPRVGSKIAVTEAARNLICSGAQPLVITDGLNFGAPDTLEGFWKMRECVLGISEACRELGTPVISGNVSLYNGSEKRDIYPTPIIGMIGLIEDIDKTISMDFKEEGDIIIFLGKTGNEPGAGGYTKGYIGEHICEHTDQYTGEHTCGHTDEYTGEHICEHTDQYTGEHTCGHTDEHIGEHTTGLCGSERGEILNINFAEGLGASEYLAEIHGLEKGKVSNINFALERRLHKFILNANERNLLQSAHDIAEGGLAVALAECSMRRDLGIEIKLDTGFGNNSEIESGVELRNVGELGAGIESGIEPENDKGSGVGIESGIEPENDKGSGAGIESSAGLGDAEPGNEEESKTETKQDIEFRKDIVLFGETQSRFIITVKPKNLDSIQELMIENRIPNIVLGTVKGENFKIDINGEETINLPVKGMSEAWKEALRLLME